MNNLFSGVDTGIGASRAHHRNVLIRDHTEGAVQMGLHRFRGRLLDLKTVKMAAVVFQTQGNATHIGRHFAAGFYFTIAGVHDRLLK